MTSRALIAFIAAVLATISGLAYASPADPTWIPGVYDDADFRDAGTWSAAVHHTRGGLPGRFGTLC